MEGRLQLHSVSFAEFDIDVGNTLTHRYPQFTLDDYDDEFLGNCCLPDGGHIHREDRTFLVLKNIKVDNTNSANKKAKKQKKKKKEDGNEQTSSVESETRTLYGVGYFLSKNDSTVKRGAIQKALLILSYHPYFELFSLPAKATLERYLSDKSSKEGKYLLKNFYEAVQAMEKTQNYQLQLYGETYPINIPVLDEDEFEGASLVDLINHFQLDTIVIWYCLLLQKRILFVGQPAREVGNCCLAAPLLVAPLTGWTKIITPYVALTDISPVMRPTYICGSTNLLFETKTDWWDAMGSFSSGCVVNNVGVRCSGRDREFMKNIISGINDARGEEWVRQQFYAYTANFLLNVAEKNLRKEHRRHFANFSESPIYHAFRNDVSKAKNVKDTTETNPGEIFKQLQDSLKQPEFDKTAQIKMLYALSTKLQDLTEIEKVCNLDGVATVAAILNESNSQMRKYAVSVLAQLALSLSGQIAMMSDQVLSRVLEMLNDPMPNVASAACYCLLKISTLYIGVQTLITHDITTILSKKLADPDSNLDMKTRGAATLLQIYRFSPSTQIPPGLLKYLHSQLKSPDKNYKSTVLQLLDQWGEELPQISISQSMKTHVSSLKTCLNDGEPCLESRITASHNLLSDLVKSTEIRLELVEAQGVEAINDNIRMNGINESLSNFSFSILSIVSDSNFGRKKIIRYRIIEYACQLLQDSDNMQYPLLLFGVARFLEVCAQHKDTGSFFLQECSGIKTILTFLGLCHDNDQALLCIPALGCLRYLMIFFDVAVKEEIRGNSKTVKLLYDMLSENTEIDGDQSGNRKLRELSWSVLRMCSE